MLKVIKTEMNTIFAGLSLGEVQGVDKKNKKKEVGLLHKAGIRHRSAYQTKHS